ncbi:MAG: alpha amylase C-terminal domain-containing protein [Phycisphaerae bacterium]
MSSLLTGALVLLLAGNDNNVEWNGVSHIWWQDRAPRCPVNGQAFSVFIQTYRFDVTSVRVRVDDGTVAWVNASWLKDRGPYAVWKADLPATASTTLRYYFELNDGTDTDYYSASGMWDDPPTDGGFLIDYATLSHAPLGATVLPNNQGAVFRVWAPSASVAYVRGEFNNWGGNDQMLKTGSYFAAYVPSAHAGQRYKFFFIPGSLWQPDPRGAALLPGSTGYDSLLVDPDGFAWTDANFVTPKFEDLVIYELHVGTFSGRNDPLASGSIPGTYRDVAAHVMDLVELGANAVELMPITEFPWDFSAGYNPISMFAAESKHGTPDDLKYMINTLHAHGIAVLLDVVWNHFSGTDNFLWNYDGGQIYFDASPPQTPWGAQADFDRPEVRDYFADSAQYWLQDFHIDGFRADGTAFMAIYQGWGWGLMQRRNDEMDRRWVDKISTAEHLPNDPWVTRPTGLGGAGFDAQWFDAFNDSVRGAIFDAAFGDPNMNAVAGALIGGGPYLYGPYVVNYVESHDEAWPSSGGQRLVRSIDTTAPYDDMWAKGRHKLAHGLAILAPGIPLFLQGAEWLEDTNFGPGDPTGVDRIDWSKKTTYANIHRFFRDVIRVRKTNGALRANSPSFVHHVNDSGNVVAQHRWDLAGNDLIVIANFSNTNYTNYQIGFPQAGRWYELLNSQSSLYDGNNWGNNGFIDTSPTPQDGMPHSAWITIPQMGLLVFRYNDPPDPVVCPGDLNGDRLVNSADLGILLSAWQSTAAGDLNGDGQTTEADLGIVLGNWDAICP